MATLLAELLKERPERKAVKNLIFPLVNKFAIPQAYGSKIAYALTSGIMQQYRFFNLGRYPHPASGAILLKMNFIYAPNIDTLVI